MKEITQYYIKNLYLKTGTLAKSARLNYGSRKNIVSFTLPYRKEKLDIKISDLKL